MRRIWLFLMSALTVLAFVITPTSAGAAVDTEGLWPSNHQAAVTGCGSHSRDDKNFCYITVDGSVELV